MRPAAVPFTMAFMTTMTFQEFFSENLEGFGWSLSSRDIPDAATYGDTVVRLAQWWDSLDNHTRDIIRAADFSQGLNDQGYFSAFPGMYTLMSGNPMGTFDATLNDIIACGRRANQQVEEQPEVIANIDEVVGS